MSDVTTVVPAATPWYTFVGTTRSALGVVPKMPRLTWCDATNPGRSAASTQSIQSISSAAGPAAARVAARSWPLPTIDTSTSAPRSCSDASAAPITGAPCSGVKSPTKHTRSGGGRRGHGLLEPDMCRTHRHHHRAGARRPGQLGELLVGVHHHDVGPRQRRTVDQVQQAIGGAGVETPVTHGVGEADQVVQHELGAPPQQTGQVHVQVAHVADHHDVGSGDPPAARHRAHERSTRPARRAAASGERAAATLSAVDAPSGSFTTVTSQPASTIPSRSTVTRGWRNSS